MNKSHLLRASLAFFAVVFSAANLSADVVETKNGARIVGKVSKIDGGSVVIATDFAGTISIKQSEVVSINTDAPVSVRLASGTRIDGKVSGSAGTLQVVGADGTISTTVEKVAASWTAGGKDPELAVLERGWAYEANVDVTGKSGNKSQLATSAGLRATLAGVHDKLVFYTAYDRQVSDGTKSADQFKAGSDYQSNFAGKKSWYVRDEGGFDRIKLIRLYNVAGFGLGYDLIKKPKQTLTGRAGLSYRYEAYSPNPTEVAKFMAPPSSLSADAARRMATTETVSSAGLDFGLAHSLQFDHASLVNRFSVVPSFDDFANYRATHESFLELPLANPSWKLRVGLNNDYNSKPGIGVDKLDTGYFTRFVLNWK